MHALGFFMRISGKIFQSRFDQKLSIKVCLKFFNQGPVDPYLFFNQGLMKSFQQKPAEMFSSSHVVNALIRENVWPHSQKSNGHSHAIPQTCFFRLSCGGDLVERGGRAE